MGTLKGLEYAQYQVAGEHGLPKGLSTNKQSYKRGPMDVNSIYTLCLRSGSDIRGTEKQVRIGVRVAFIIIELLEVSEGGI